MSVEKKLTKLEFAIIDAVKKGKTKRGDIVKYAVEVAASNVQYSDKAGRGLGQRFDTVMDELVGGGFLRKEGRLFSSRFVLTEAGEELYTKSQEQGNET